MKINHNQFKIMIDRASQYVSKEWSRKVLRQIKVDIKNGELTVCAVDGYKGIRCIATMPTSEEISFLMHPIKLKNDKSGAKEVDIKVVDRVATITVMTEYGAIDYRFQQSGEDFVDMNKVMPTRIGKTEIAFTANLLSEAIKSFGSKRRSVIHFFFGSPAQPVLITNEDDFCKSEVVVLPARVCN
jgi:DNA polymerase III sliding clamp (beta) subunit (PCNA family)